MPGLERLSGAPISGAAGDQQAALFGQACFSPGMAKCTYGTGCFLLMHTGGAPVQSRHGLVSTIAWGLAEGKAEYALEGSVFNAGSVIQWLRDDLKLISSSPEIDVLAASVPDAGGAILVPAFTGLGAPHWDMYARGALLGLTRGTGRAHIARAVLESIAFQVCELLEAMDRDGGAPLLELRVDGGASVSDVMMQFQSDMLGCVIDRPRNVETTAWGAASLAGLAAGLWRDKEEIALCRQREKAFTPVMTSSERERRYAQWKRAVERASGWARPEEA